MILHPEKFHAVYYKYTIHIRAERRLALPLTYCSLATGLFRGSTAAPTSSMRFLIGGVQGYMDGS